MINTLQCYGSVRIKRPLDSSALLREASPVLKHISSLERGMTLSGNLKESMIKCAAQAASASWHPALIACTIIAVSGRDADHKDL